MKCSSQAMAYAALLLASGLSHSAVVVARAAPVVVARPAPVVVSRPAPAPVAAPALVKPAYVPPKLTTETSHAKPPTVVVPPVMPRGATPSNRECDERKQPDCKR